MISFLYLFFSNEKSTYIPETDEAAVIYREACMHGHGDRGQGSGFFYPAIEENLNRAEIRKLITEGSLLMPVFIHIKSDTLDQLIQYIQSGLYKTKN